MSGPHTPGPWLDTEFSDRDGNPITSISQIEETLAYSARYGDRLALLGVSLDDKDADGRSTVVCYTGNGPNAHNNARLIAAAPDLLAALEALRLQALQSSVRDPSNEWGTEALALANAAIARARGEQA